MPAGSDTVFSFLTEKAEKEAKRPATLRRYLTSISTAHDGAGQPNPTSDARIVELMAGILRTLGGRQRKAAPLTMDVLKKIHPHAGVREWAVLCFGQAIACRRSELCALDLEDVKIDGRGVAVFFKQSKTDQEKLGETIGVPRRTVLCPVAALEAYLNKRGMVSGPLFHGARVPRMTTKDVDRIVKRAVETAGLDAKDYSAHSLRAGYVTEERRQGKTWAEIMAHTRHTRLETVKGYARYERDPFERPVDG
jgi:integrase